jgi:hypothetical protein
MINLTPHSIALQLPSGEVVTFPPSGKVAIVETFEEVVGEAFGVPVIKRTLGEAFGLPEEGIPCLVSSFVLEASKVRAGVYAPDSGNTAVRNEKGHVKAVTRLVAA